MYVEYGKCGNIAALAPIDILRSFQINKTNQHAMP